MKLPRWLLWIECLSLFLLLPGVLSLNGFHRPTLYTGLWVTCVYCFWMLVSGHGFSWRHLWQGEDWDKQARFYALLRFVAATSLAILIIGLLAPGHLFDFPRYRPEMWLMVMTFYPLISVVPQELVYRSFFCRRYAALFGEHWLMILANASCFAFMHIVLQNWVAPLLCLIGGLLFSYSYRQHRSLKWASLEHAAYGCMIFTVGLGTYFFHGLRPT